MLFRNISFLIVWFVFLQTEVLASVDENKSVYGVVSSDYGNFYTTERLSRLGLGFVAASLLANTSVDGDVRDTYQNDVRSGSTDDFSESAKIFGEGKIFIPFSLLAVSTKYIDDSAFGDWGANTIRSFAMGAPAMLLMQKVTGGSRPWDNSNGSEWNFFDDTNGVSGHAFIGSISFIVIARMNEGDPWINYSAYAFSTLAAWSRVNDDDHYLSQALLGWYMGWESVDAIMDTNSEKSNVSFAPMIGRDSLGVTMNIYW
jgi:hypothetical protein